MDVNALFSKMIVLFLTLLAGYVAAKAGVINESANKAFSSLIANVTNPLQVIASVLVSGRPMTNTQVLSFSGVALCCYIVMLVSSRLVPKVLGAPKRDEGLFRFMYAFSNISFMGYPVATALFGRSAMFYVTVFVLFFQIIVWSYGVHLISGRERFRFSLKLLLRPCIVSALLAYAIYFSGLELPAVIGQACEFAGGVTSPLAMIVIGCSLAQLPLKDVFSNWKVYILAVVKMIAIPVAAFFLLRNILTDQLMLGVVIMVLSMPCATNTTIISYQENANVKLASSGVFLTTLLSVITLPLLMTLLFA